MVFVLQVAAVHMLMPAEEMVMRMPFASDLAEEIEEAEEEESGAGDCRKPSPDPLAQRDPEERDEETERGCH